MFVGQSTWPISRWTYEIITINVVTLQRYNNERDGVANHQPHDCILNHLFGHRSKKTSKFRVTGLCEGNSPVTDEFSAQRASNAENVSIWWRHYELRICTAGIDVIQLDYLLQKLRAKLFRGNKNIYLHFMSFFHIDMIQVVEIHPLVRHELIYSTYSISWVPLSWRRKEPRHQQPWYWTSYTKITRSPHVKAYHRLPRLWDPFVIYSMYNNYGEVDI